jgi:transcriptional regulator with XRE-family HTH domain
MQYSKQVKQKNYSKVIKDFRDKNKLTQASVAEALGVRQKTISDWENGKSSARDFLAGVRFAMLALQKGMELEDLIMGYPEPPIASEDKGEYNAQKKDPSLGI